MENAQDETAVGGDDEAVGTFCRPTSLLQCRNTEGTIDARLFLQYQSYLDDQQEAAREQQRIWCASYLQDIELYDDDSDKQDSM
jgi:hypothetical protein